MIRRNASKRDLVTFDPAEHNLEIDYFHPEFKNRHYVIRIDDYQAALINKGLHMMKSSDYWCNMANLKEQLSLVNQHGEPPMTALLDLIVMLAATVCQSDEEHKADPDTVNDFNA